MIEEPASGNACRRKSLQHPFSYLAPHRNIYIPMNGHAGQIKIKNGLGLLFSAAVPIICVFGVKAESRMWRFLHHEKDVPTQ